MRREIRDGTMPRACAAPLNPLCATTCEKRNKSLRSSIFPRNLSGPHISPAPTRTPTTFLGIESAYAAYAENSYAFQSVYGIRYGGVGRLRWDSPRVRLCGFC